MADTNFAKEIGIFLGGFAAGGFLAYTLTKKKYRDIADKEVASVLERFTVPKDIPSIEESTTKMSLAFEEPFVKAEVPDESKDIPVAPPEDPSSDDEPYVISVDDFTDEIQYDKETLIFYEKDGVLTDQYDRVLCVPDVLGACDFIAHFEDDICYVRNNALMTDYEICLEHKNSPPTALMEGDIKDDDD